MTILSITEFVGHLHPMLVHFPIGILLMASIFRLVATIGKSPSLQPAVPVMIFWGMLAAIVSCISGLLLSQGADYDQALITRHKWLGIGTAVISIALYITYKRRLNPKLTAWISALLVILVATTGHLGGSLTHGEDYLSASFGNVVDTGPALPPIPQVQEAHVYNDIVQPLLEARCYNCHGTNKQKGKLRLDQPGLILKGGEDGKIISDSNPDESEMIKRLMLPIDAKKHMPPKERAQLTPEELAFLHWWVTNGAPFDSKVNQLAMTSGIQPVLAALQSGTTAGPVINDDLPAVPVEPAPSEIVNRLKKAGVMIVPVAQNSNYLSANFVTASSTTDTIISLLESLKGQLVWLKLDGARLSDSAFRLIGRDTLLRRLQLSNTTLTDQSIIHLRSLKNLRSLNIVNTRVTFSGIQVLRELKHLRHLYLYQTEISNADWPALLRAFPDVALDSGNYSLPMLPGDTTVIRLP